MVYLILIKLNLKHHVAYIILLVMKFLGVTVTCLYDKSVTKSI
jgi:hypothetical protein